MNAPKATIPEATTVAELLEKIREAAKGGDYIYRGESKKHPQVTSTLYRDYQDKIDAENFDIEVVEKEILSEVRKHTHEKDDNVILEQLQHYGGKTNQIDFSTDYLVALFFACYGKYRKNGRLILLNKKGTRTHEPTNPQNRVIAQKSIFVRSPKGFVEPNDEVTVPGKLKKEVLEYLNKYHNINTATIYNDIHGYIAQTEIHDSASTHFYLGLTHQSKDEFPQAIKEYNKAIKLNPNSAVAYNNRGNTYRAENKHARAITDFNKAIELNPNHVMAYNNRGVAYSDKNKRALALADFNKAIELDPSYATAYNNRGGVYGKRGDYDKAIADYNKAIELNPNDAVAYGNRGGAYNKREYDLAITDFNKAIELNPNDAVAYNNRGAAYVVKGDYAHNHASAITAYICALADFSKAIKLDPNYVRAYINRGIAKKALQDSKGEKEDFKTALLLAKQQKRKDLAALAQEQIDDLSNDSDS